MKQSFAQSFAKCREYALSKGQKRSFSFSKAAMISVLCISSLFLGVVSAICFFSTQHSMKLAVLDKEIAALSRSVKSAEVLKRRLEESADVFYGLLNEALELDRKQSGDVSVSDGGARGRLGVGGVNEDIFFDRYFSSSFEDNYARQTVHPAFDIEGFLEDFSSVPIGSPVDGRISSKYGMRRSPSGGRKMQMHKGVDIAVNRKSEVVSTADGQVVKASRSGGYGLTIIIEHAGSFETLYGHLSRIDVSVGDKVCRGERIGLIGSTGRSTGPHLHYEIKLNKKQKNPLGFMEIASFMGLL